MRIPLTLLLLTVCASATAIPNPNAGLIEAKARSPVVLKFRVIKVEYIQEGDILFTFAEAEVLQVIRVRPPIRLGSVVKISYGANYVRVKNQFTEDEIMAKMKAEVGWMPARSHQIPRLREGVIATGWFSFSEDGQTLRPAIQDQSFEYEQFQEILPVRWNDEFRLSPGQIAIVGAELEIRLISSMYEPCPTEAVCIVAGFWVYRFDLIADGKHRAVLLKSGQRAEPEFDGYKIEITSEDGSDVTIRASRAQTHKKQASAEPQ